MKRDPRLTFITGALFAAVAWLPPLFGQAASPAPAEPPEDDIVTLSPFVVSSETERGYQATETLAGMRIKTNLKDTAAAIDVLTDQFLNDVGATDMFDALKYVANMEYASYQASDQSNASQWFSSSYISRGISGSTVLLDFFPTGAVPVDRYNTENLTLMRGANAILFGIGNPSGIIGASTKRASLNRNINTVRFLADTNETLRTEFDFSRVLIKNKLALRVAAVFSDKHTDQEPSLDRRNAVFGTVTYKPFSGTTITVNAENGIRNRLFVQNHIVMDAYTPWVLAGKPMVMSRAGWTAALYPFFPQTGPAYSTAVRSGLQNTSSGSYLVKIENDPSLPIMDWRGMARGSQWGNMYAGTPTWTPGTMLNSDRDVLNNQSFYPSTAIVPLNLNLFGDTNRNDLDYQRKSVVIEQQLLPDLDLELAWNQFTSNYLFKIHAYSNAAKLFADPNVYLPDGRPNPYAGMPFFDTGTGGNSMRDTGSLEKYITKRATLSYHLDLDDKKIFRNIGLGDYRFGGLAQDANYSQKLLSTHIVNVTPINGNTTTNALNQNANRVSHRYYLTPGGGNTFNLLTPPTQAAQPTIAGLPSNLLGSGANPTGAIQLEERMVDESPRNERRDTKSYVAALQGSWWESKDGSYYHLSGLYGWREDTQRNHSQSFPRNALGEYLVPVTPDRAYHLIEPNGVWGTPSEITAHTTSYNVMLRPISQVRFFYNYSDIFRAAAATFADISGTSLRPAYGETEDYGVKVDLFDERVFISATKYETAQRDSSVDNTGTIREPIQQILAGIVQNAGLPANQQVGPAASTAELQEITRLQDDLIRPFAYRDDSTEGYEFAVTASITSNWNARLTFGIQKTTVSALAEEWLPYHEQYLPFWQKFAANGLVNQTDANYMNVGHAIARAQQRLVDYRSIIGQQPGDQRTRNSSLATSYRFTEGRLKGFRIGGGYRWASENVIGYARDASGNLDRERPFRGKAEIATDASIGYTRRFGSGGKFNWDVQLNVYNLLDDQSIRAYQAVDDGNGNPLIARTYLPEPLTVQLTNTISF
jgi:outer membrane receptor for ferric coprogen and ferric-rhodotorulic acid